MHDYPNLRLMNILYDFYFLIPILSYSYILVYIKT